MNCFHFSVSLGYTTTKWYYSSCRRLLWIAFIFQYLWDTQQQIYFRLLLAVGCELLSFFSIFGIHNNSGHISPALSKVVNCFHFSVSLGYTTTIIQYSYHIFLLWIAFIFQYLWDTQQQRDLVRSYESSCELLSFFSIFGIHNNK